MTVVASNPGVEPGNALRHTHRAITGYDTPLRKVAQARILSSMSIPPHRRYGRYAGYYGLVKTAVEAGDVAQLGRIQNVSSALAGDDRKASSLAIHDVARRLPLRSEAHLMDLVAGDWNGADDYFVRLLEALRARAKKQACPGGTPRDHEAGASLICSAR